MGYYVPETMKQLNNWVVWSIEKTAKGKVAKIPYNPKTGRKASTTDRKTWASYEEAVTRKNHGDFDGIGFVFTEESGLVFIDLDDCFTADGEETTLAQEVQALFPGTYTEVSQSENGLHIVCLGSIPKAFKRAEIEVYTKGRYMAFTGNATSPTEPQKAQECINTLFERYAHTEPQKAPQSKPQLKSNLSIEIALENIKRSKQGAKFEKLLAGDWSNYNSQSEADQAFISIAHHFCHGDNEMILTLWERSGLSARSKAKRNEYVYRMIENARRTHTGSATKRIYQRSGVTDQTQKNRRRLL